MEEETEYNSFEESERSIIYKIRNHCMSIMELSHGEVHRLRILPECDLKVRVPAKEEMF